MSDLLEVAHLSVEVMAEGRPRQVLRDVSLTIAAGEALGLVGESGSGKTMTARAVGRILPDHAHMRGEIRFNGTSVPDLSRTELRTLRRHGMSHIPQDPRSAINPVHRVGDFLTEPQTSLDGRSRDDARTRAIGALRDVGIDDGQRVLNQFPHQLSGGMLQRVMICAALLAESQLIIADEPTTALDVTTQSDVMAVLDELRRERGLALLFISHDLELAIAICDRISVMYAGEIVEAQPAVELEAKPRHPYTSALFAARPRIDKRRGRLAAVPGRARAAHEIGAGCGFSDRCAFVQDRCSAAEIPLSGGAAHYVRCLRADEIADQLEGVGSSHGG